MTRELARETPQFCDVLRNMRHMPRIRAVMDAIITALGERQEVLDPAS